MQPSTKNWMAIPTTSTMWDRYFHSFQVCYLTKEWWEWEVPKVSWESKDENSWLPSNAKRKYICLIPSWCESLGTNIYESVTIQMNNGNLWFGTAKESGYSMSGSFIALALKNANAISKAFLAFHSSKTFASKNGIPHYCKIFCNSTTVQF